MAVLHPGFVCLDGWFYLRLLHRYVNFPVGYLPWFVLTFTSGQIAGFTTMNDFKMRFAEQHADGTYAFSNVRNGLIVGLVSPWIPHLTGRMRIKLT